MKKAIQRLQKSLEEHEGQNHIDGVKAGGTWAKQQASYQDLLRLSTFCKSDEFLNYFDNDGEKLPLGARLAIELHEEPGYFWTSVQQEDHDRYLDDDFVSEFIGGALYVFHMFEQSQTGRIS